MLIDTHCHLDDPRLLLDIDSILDSARAAGVEYFVIPGVTVERWHHITSLSRNYSCILPAFGLHPAHAASWTPPVLERLIGMEGIAIGEIGLDYSLDQPPRPLQQEAFRAQLRVAAEKKLPVLVHCRRAFSDLIAIMREEHVARVGGIMHAFSGSVEIARECIDQGFLIAIGGTATYHNAVKPLKVISEIPLRHLVLETDAPDMAPEPYRGELNQPRYLELAAAKVASIKGVTVEEVAQITTENFRRLIPNALLIQ